MADCGAGYGCFYSKAAASLKTENRKVGFFFPSSLPIFAVAYIYIYVIRVVDVCVISTPFVYIAAGWFEREERGCEGWPARISNE